MIIMTDDGEGTRIERRLGFARCDVVYDGPATRYELCIYEAAKILRCGSIELDMRDVKFEQGAPAGWLAWMSLSSRTITAGGSEVEELAFMAALRQCGWLNTRLYWRRQCSLSAPSDGIVLLDKHKYHASLSEN